MSRTEFVLIRHAQSDWNLQRRWQGHADPMLTPHGREQAARVAAELAGERIDRLLCSDLRRAFETARIVGAARGLVAAPDPRLRELDVGRWEGLRRDEIARLDPEGLARFDAGDPDARPGGGETRRELRVRVRTAFAHIAARHPGEHLGVVTHLGVILALLPGTELENTGWCRVPATAFAPVDA